MAKRRYRVDASNYGGELVVGIVGEQFVKDTCNLDETDLVDAVLSFDDFSQPDEPDDALKDPEKEIAIPYENYNMWEADDLEHINSSYADGKFTVTEVTGVEDHDWNENSVELDPEVLYSREGAYLSKTIDDDVDNWKPVLMFHSAEKGNFACWFIDTDKEFDPKKLVVGEVETEMGSFVDRVFYDKKELDPEYDYNDTMGKGYYAMSGWLNIKWRDSYTQVDENLDEYWQDFDES